MLIVWYISWILKKVEAERRKRAAVLESEGIMQVFKSLVLSHFLCDSVCHSAQVGYCPIFTCMCVRRPSQAWHLILFWPGQTLPDLTWPDLTRTDLTTSFCMSVSVMQLVCFSVCNCLVVYFFLSLFACFLVLFVILLVYLSLIVWSCFFSGDNLY